MKKSILLAALAFFALAGCTKPDQTTPNEASQDGPRVTLNLTVAPKDAFGTKAIKAAWEDNDYIYLFFAPTGASTYNDLKNVVVKYDSDSSKWEVEETDAESLAALSAIDASGVVLAIYTSGPKRPIEEDAVNGLFHLGEANAYGLTMSQVTDYNFSAGVVDVSLYLTRHATAQITVTGITNDANNQWVLYSCGVGAEVFNGISRLAAVFESGAFNETALCETSTEEVIGVNNGSDAVTFYVAGIDYASQSVRLILHNTKTHKNYVRILDAANKVEDNNAYTIPAPTLNEEGNIEGTSSWHQGFLIEYTTNTSADLKFDAASSAVVVKGYDSATQRGYVVFKGGCPMNAFNSENSLTSFALQKGISTIGQNACYGCVKLATVKLPEGVTTIEDLAFIWCSGLEQIELPSTLTTIGNYAFDSCSSLTTVTCLPATPPSLGMDAFRNPNSSLTIYVPNTSLEAYQSAWSGLTIQPMS